MSDTRQIPESFHTGQALLLASVAALGGFLFGFDTAVVNGTVTAVREGFGLSAGLTGFVVSSALLGCVVGAFTAGRLADRIGRVRVMLIAASLFLVSAVGCTFAVGAADLIVWRVIGGLGVGTASVIAPAYIAEISPAQIRGRLGSMQQLAIVTGIFVALLCNAWLAGLSGGAAEQLWFGLETWRWMFFAEVVPALAYGAFALMIPESPRFLVKKGSPAKAREVLSRVLETGIDQRIEEIRQSLGTEARTRLKHLRGPALGLLPIVWVGILLSTFQQFVGINVIFYYSSTLWQAVGFTEADALAQTVITGVTNIVVTIIAIALVDKIGRRRLLMIGSTGMTLTLGLLAWIFATAPVVEAADGTLTPQLTDTGGVVALLAANGFVVFFGMSWGPAVWVLLGEMFNNRIRATALGIAAAAQWMANFTISTTFPALADMSLGVAYGFYTTCAAISLFFVIRFVPETKGKQLEDME
ncbi:sugar porter family MFS transporter [Nesterenkonia xinjiangensis]|uniref:Sugar porter (SP) family MFS transporter n=1 Tax=Nesterenkonia xinjiangensis TaxID=225327 RepID=A0A7Z0GMQ0_9MICC|nr:sugar porter family MFS transporter [Nesterenkonia xinjiangensis]NYJ77728.1 sugar porter (SP) family MFS transporter [Nesterenkonia xinjiangensis]